MNEADKPTPSPNETKDERAARVLWLRNLHRAGELHPDPVRLARAVLTWEPNFSQTPTEARLNRRRYMREYMQRRRAENKLNGGAKK